jgi:hypothetical protein
MLRRRGAVLLASLAPFTMLLLLAGCAGAPAPDPDGPILTGPQALPRLLATVELSATPDVAAIEATLAQGRPTATFGPPTRTPTITPYVGIFMGDLTPLPGTIVYRPADGRGPVIVPVPVTPPAAAPPGLVLAPTPILGLTGPGFTGDPGTACPISPAAPFVSASLNPAIRARLGCPTGESFPVGLVGQFFQNGIMIWRDTREIYAVSLAAIRGQGAAMDTFWRVPDTWSEGMPADDASFSPPPGLVQPVRGFGWIWRNNQAIRDTLGWALAPEDFFQAVWQNYERGWMMTGPDGSVYALSPSDASPATTGVHFGTLPQ